MLGPEGGQDPVWELARSAYQPRLTDDVAIQIAPVHEEARDLLHKTLDEYGVVPDTMENFTTTLPLPYIDREGRTSYIWLECEGEDDSRVTIQALVKVSDDKHEAFPLFQFRGHEFIRNVRGDVCQRGEINWLILSLTRRLRDDLKKANPVTSD